MALLNTQTPSIAGVAVTYSAAGAGGDTFVNNGRERVHIKNGSGSPITVTFTAGAANANVCSFGVANVAHAVVVTVPATGDRMIGPFNKEHFNNPANSQVAITYSDVTTVTIAVLA